jgi:Uncharacterised nucleotidyltransferase
MARDPNSHRRRSSGEYGAGGVDPLEDFAKRVRERVGDLPDRKDIDDAAVEVLAAFAAHDVDALVLKGPALARILYATREQRGYRDVDLLVAPRDLPAARRALADLGCTNTSERLGIGEVAGTLNAEIWLRGGRTAGEEVMIDLHWRLAGSQAPPEATWEALARRRTWIDVDGRRLPVLRREGLAMHLALHVAQHGARHRKPVEDLTVGLERWSPGVWRGAERLAREIDATEAFAAGLRLVPAGAALARDLRLPATNALQWEIANRGARPRGTFHLQALVEAATLPERASVLRRSLLPRREWLVRQYPWAKGSRPRLFAAYGLHLMRAPVWATRAWLFRRRAERAG